MKTEQQKKPFGLSAANRNRKELLEMDTLFGSKAPHFTL